MILGYVWGELGWFIMRGCPIHMYHDDLILETDPPMAASSFPALDLNVSFHMAASLDSAGP